MEKCPECGKKYTKYPIFKNNTIKNKWQKDNIIWKNLFKIDTLTVIIFISLALTFYGFYEIKQDCGEAMKNPCNFCEKSGCVKYPMCRQNNNTFSIITDRYNFTFS